MALNQTTLIAEISAQMVRDDADLIGATGRISLWLNWGLTRIDRFADLKGLGKHVKAACVVGQTEYAFPTDLKYVRTFRLLDHILTTFAVGDVDTADHIITVDEDIATGTRLIFLSSTLPSGLTTGTTYYAIKVTSATIKVATSSANATAGTAVSLGSTGTGTHALEIFTSENSRLLVYVPEKEFDSGSPDITQVEPGKAERYIDKADIYELDTPPDARYVLDQRYIKWQDELGDGETPEVSRIDDLIVAATIVEGWHALGEIQLRDAAQGYFMNMLASHKAVNRLRPDYAPTGKGFGSEGIRNWNIDVEAYKYPFIKR